MLRLPASALALAVLALALPATAATPAATSAAAGDLTRTFRLDGRSLAIATPCAARVTIERASDAAISITATARNPAELEHLTAGGTNPARLEHTGRCATRGWADRATLEIAIRAPEGLQLAIEERGSTDYVVDVPLDTLAAELHGSGNLRAESATRTTLAMRGSGDASLGAVNGALDAQLSGSGDLQVRSLKGSLVARTSGSGDVQVGDIAADSVELTSSGSGDATLARGSIGRLQASTSGSGDLSIGAEVGDLTAVARGSGDVQIPHATGQVRSESHGSGDVSIGR